MSAIGSMISNHPFLEGLKPEHVAVLAATASEVAFDPGAIIFRERESASCFYLVTAGEIAIEAHGRASQHDVRIDTVIANEVLGWSWLFAPYCWHFQARAVTAVEAVCIDAATLLVRCESDRELGFEVMKRMTQTLIRRLQHARQIVVELDTAMSRGSERESAARSESAFAGPLTVRANLSVRRYDSSPARGTGKVDGK